MAYLNDEEELGRVEIAPETGQVGTWGTWVATYTAGPQGVAEGGGVQIALPVRWHQWLRNATRRLQTVDPTAPFYVTARSSRDDVGLGCKIPGETDNEYAKHPRLNLGGTRSMSRYGWTVSVTLERGALRPGDAIDVVYGDKSGGGRGFTPPLYAGSPEVVHAAVDATGEGEYRMLPRESLPLLSHTPGPPVELLIVLPSRSVVGERGSARLVALDEYQNPVSAPDILVRLVVAEGEAVLEPSAIDLGGPATLGSCEVAFTPIAPGVVRVRGTSEDGNLHSLSNPSKVYPEPPGERLYWGDIHSHSQYSEDGTGTDDDQFRYARHGSLLDVFAASDHNGRGSLNVDDWRQTVEDTIRWYEPGRFVTVFGFESSYGKPYGHHNVYYADPEGAFWQLEDMTLEEAWERGTPGEMLTIPHHTGGTMGAPPSGVNHDWSIHDPRFRTNAEIYSSHGHSEEYAPNHPLSMEVSDFTFQGSQDPGNYLQDAWLAGLKLGVIASSDNHMSQPGKEGFGTMAVWAPELTRQAVFDAIRERRTYGTTGSRIYLEFYVNGRPMGSDIEIAPGERARVQVEVLGTSPLRWVEVLRADLDRPDEGFEVVHREWSSGWSGPPFGSKPMTDVQLYWTDDSPPPNGMYYVRVRQSDIVHGRVAEGWSSPVWVRAV